MKEDEGELAHWICIYITIPPAAVSEIEDNRLDLIGGGSGTTCFERVSDFPMGWSRIQVRLQVIVNAGLW